MATKQTVPAPGKPGKLFDVTCVIGAVYTDSIFDGEGMTAYEAAFHLIAKHGTDGEFTFPDGGEGICRVTIEFPGRNNG